MSEDTPTQDEDTRHIMRVLKDARMSAQHTYVNAANVIEAASLRDYENGIVRWRHRITPDEYRAMEQNMTKTVPLWVVMYLCHEYRISAERLLGDLLGEYIYG